MRFLAIAVCSLGLLLGGCSKNYIPNTDVEETEHNRKVVEFVDEEIEALQNAIARKLGYKLVDHRLELYGVPIEE